ncbi:uncharacterized protein [Henckelia pumila]|uniref:uncharacterized protein n=1 Tax=Henckelia pumila TaxID=405737 RepID=UPI003C6E3CF9
MDIIVADELRELRHKIQKLEETVSRESRRVKAQNWPFSREVINEPLPAHYKSAKIRDYDGSTDLEEHLAWFENVAMLHFYEDKIKCKVFLTTLVDSAQRWFEKLESGCIRSFANFHEGLREREFFKSLVKKTPRDFEDSLDQAEKYINMEESWRQKREMAQKEGGKDQGVREGNPVSRSDNLGRLSSYAPQKQKRSNLEEMKQTDKKPRGLPWIVRSNASIPPKPINPDRRRDREHNPRKTDRQREERTSRGVIKMISGGSTDGDSNRTRKARGRKEILCAEVKEQRNIPIITFGQRDLDRVHAPHKDALMIQAKVDNHDVRRVFVNSGSSVNVIFQGAFEQMDLQGYELSPMKIALYGFAGHTVHPKGEMLLHLTLGSGDLRMTTMILFALVDAIYS